MVVTSLDYLQNTLKLLQQQSHQKNKGKDN